MTRLLIVDDDETMRMALSESLESCGYEVETAGNGSEALERFPRGHYAAVITDMRMPKMGGMEVLRHVKKMSPRTPVVMITAYGTVHTAVEAMKEGAADFIMKPFSLTDLESVVRRVLAMNEEDSAPPEGEGREVNIITDDPKMKAMLDLLKTVARSRSTVLIQGESGTGKELFARFIHRWSERSQMPFVAVNCAAIPHNLLESEMFGFEKGAFTGAFQRKAGKFELAHGGTLLLDEVSEMDVQLQAKLLRVLQESEIDRLGGRSPVPVDVRVVATTNTDLKAAMEEKKFREDLFYRLNVIPVKIPPLRERLGDILPLCHHFLQKYSERNRRRPPRLVEGMIRLLQTYPWPGNVRELENIMERAVLICDGDVLKGAHLFMDDPAPAAEVQGPNLPGGPAREEGGTLREMEKSLIFETLEKVAGNRTRAARILGISVRTMRNKLHEYGVEAG